MSGLRVLLLGGTAEARELAALLVDQGIDVTTSLAGAVRRPQLPVGAVRVGGFGGTAGLAAHLVDHAVDHVVDATHPFADTISANAAAAATEVGVPLTRLERPGWGTHRAADTWTWVDDVAGAVRAGAFARRPFVTTGRQSLAAFLPWANRAVLARVVDPPDLVIPDRWVVVRSRGPYDLESERRTLRVHSADLLVTKDSGGTHTVGKLDAATELGVPVVVVRRPPPVPGVRAVETVAEALAAVLA